MLMGPVAVVPNRLVPANLCLSKPMFGSGKLVLLPDIKLASSPPANQLEHVNIYYDTRIIVDEAIRFLWWFRQMQAYDTSYEVCMY